MGDGLWSGAWVTLRQPQWRVCSNVDDDPLCHADRILSLSSSLSLSTSPSPDSTLMCSFNWLGTQVRVPQSSPPPPPLPMRSINGQQAQLWWPLVSRPNQTLEDDGGEAWRIVPYSSHVYPSNTKQTRKSLKQYQTWTISVGIPGVQRDVEHTQEGTWRNRTRKK